MRHTSGGYQFRRRKYVRVSYVDARRREFMNLMQGDRTVAEYEAKFLRLSCYARGIVASEYEKCAYFEDGFKDSLRVLIAPQREQEFIVLRPKKHARPDRPSRVGVLVAPIGIQPCNDCDIGSTHSYIASSVSGNLGITVESTLGEIYVLSLLGQSVRVNRLYRNVPLEVQWVVFPTTLMELPFGEFDLILGMDWLEEHRVCLDCMTKRVVLRIEDDVEIILISDVKITCLTTLREFLDVFSYELPGLPPNRKVEFGIELLLGTTLASIAPFQMALKELIKPYLDQFIIVFIDDILAYSKTEDEDDEHLRVVVQILQEKQLYAKLRNCEFWLRKVTFLGHVVSTKGIQVDLRKIEDVLDKKQPKNVSKIRIFLGLAGYYWRFIEGFSLIATPLTKLLHKNVPFVWTDAQQSSFEKLKSVLTKATALIQPKSSKEFVV
ncbi:uncharacterized protein LOC105801150 [Gossypium raimondii]|uniref:uncharacterized protein LOC105801150 n=1 Tax=Gossypium raimondii TaxID=29730 RepID=UPI00063A8C99|nr:uncharacterized protein LOC105801150 [Gossypium raimondii]